MVASRKLRAETRLEIRLPAAFVMDCQIMECQMSKALITVIATAFLGAGTLWSQADAPEKVVRVNASARLPDSCAPQPGKSAAPAACNANAVAIGNQKKAPEVLNEVDEAANEAKPAGGPTEGIKVHGHWIIDTRNPDGTLAAHHEFENNLTSGGGSALVNSLARQGVIGLWNVAVAGNVCGVVNCGLFETTDDIPPNLGIYRTLTVGVPTSAPYLGNLVLTGSFTAPFSGTVNNVYTGVYLCSGGLPASCTNSTAQSSTIFSGKTYSQAVTAGQSVLVTVVFSFN